MPAVPQIRLPYQRSRNCTETEPEQFDCRRISLLIVSLIQLRDLLTAVPTIESALREASGTLLLAVRGALARSVFKDMLEAIASVIDAARLHHSKQTALISSSAVVPYSQVQAQYRLAM